MAEDYRLALAPILVINLRSVFGCDCVHVFFFLLMVHFRPRFISDKNQVRRSVSSIQTSIRLVVAMSRCSSHTLCASRRRAASVLLSSDNSAIMSEGST